MKSDTLGGIQGEQSSRVCDEDKLNDKTSSSLGQRGGWLINESGLYSLMLSKINSNVGVFCGW